MLVLYQQLFLEAEKKSFLVLAKNAPMHGLLTSLRTVLEFEEKDQVVSTGSTALEVIQKLR